MTQQTKLRPKKIKKCKRCGACCLDIGTPPFLPEEMAGLPQSIRETVEALFETDPDRSESGKPCYFYDEIGHACRIYQCRPKICRQFGPGGKACRDHRSAQRAGGVVAGAEAAQ